MKISDLKFLALAVQIAAAMGDSEAAVEDFNERMDAATPGDEVPFDIPDDHEPRWPSRFKGGHTGDVSKVVFRKKN